jgi:hypothetical protein
MSHFFSVWTLQSQGPSADKGTMSNASFTLPASVIVGLVREIVLGVRVNGAPAPGDRQERQFSVESRLLTLGETLGLSEEETMGLVFSIRDALS